MVALTRIALNQTLARQDRLSRRISAAEVAVSTGARLQRASEAPADWTTLSSIARARSDSAAMRGGIAAGQARGREAERTLAQLADLATRARELAIAAGGVAGGGRTALATEFAGVAADIASALDARDPAGEPLFDGAEPLLLRIDARQVTETVPARSAVATLPDGSDLTRMLDAAQRAIASGDRGALDSALHGLASATDHFADQQARQGLRLDRMQRADAALVAADVDRAEHQSALGDADIAETIATMQALAVQRDAARAMLARSGQTNLFDLLR